jgi:rhodanese-related sulfurtransferase
MSRFIFIANLFHSKRILEMVWILGLGLICGLISWMVHPRLPALIPSDPFTIDLEAVLQLPPPVLWLDARSNKEYGKNHIPGAIQLNVHEWDRLLETFILKHWTPEANIVVYCSSQECMSSQQVAQRLKKELPDAKVFSLKGGWEIWEKRK